MLMLISFKLKQDVKSLNKSPADWYEYYLKLLL